MPALTKKVFLSSTFIDLKDYRADGSEVSITEMEYEWAIERNLPVHLFTVDSDHPWPPTKVGDLNQDIDRLS